MVFGFIQNITMLVVVAGIHAVMPHQRPVRLLQKRNTLCQALSGFLFGGAGIVVMTAPLEFAPAVFCDTASIILCAAGALAGPLGAAIAAGMCAAYRLGLGGAGVLVGVCVICEAAFFGSVYYCFRLRCPRLTHMTPLVGLGLLVHTVMLALLLWLPGGLSGEVLRRISLPVLLLYPAATMLACRVFFWFETLFGTVQALHASESTLRELVDNANSIMLRLDAGGRIVFANEYARKIFNYPDGELLGRNVIETIAPGQESFGHDPVGLLHAVHSDPDANCTNENEHILKDGSRVWINWTSKGLRDESGNITEVVCIGNDVTLRKQAQNALANSLKRLQAFFSSPLIGIVSTSPSQGWIEMNQKFCDILGYTEAELRTKSWADITPPEYALREKELQDRLLGGDVCFPLNYQRYCLRKDGGRVFLDVQTDRIKPLSGDREIYLSFVQDSTEQKRVMTALEESENKYRTLFEHMALGVFCQKIDGSISDVNAAALCIFNLTRDAFFSPLQNWRLIRDDGTDLPFEEFPSMVALRTARPVREVTAGIGNSSMSGHVWVSINAIPQFHAGEAVPFQVFVTLHDITSYRQTQEQLRQHELQVERLLAESQKARRALLSILEDDRAVHEALRESEELFRSVIETATDAVITVNLEGRILLWNRAAEIIFGYSPQEILGRSFGDLLPDSIREQHITNLFKAIDSGVLTLPSRFFEVPGLRKDGSEFFAEIAFGLIKKTDGVLITQIVRDITERKLMEVETMRTAQLASIGELAAGVAHEINNPIMGVINYAQIILNRMQKQGGDSALPQRIIKEGQRIADIVSSLLYFARDASEKPEPVSVATILEPSLALMQKLFQQSGIKMEICISDTVAPVMVRPQKIQQVFINVLSNALYALNQRFPDFNNDKQFKIYAEEILDAGGVFLRVVFHDRGCGIEKACLEKICNPFFTTKPFGKGTGLGLSISHTIMKEHGGRLLFESREGEYTKVMVDLPVEK